MSEEDTTDLPIDTTSPSEQAVWAALARIERPEPGADLRRNFYRCLDEQDRPSMLQQLRAWLGLDANRGWLTVSACLLAGLLIGRGLSDVAPSDATRLDAMELKVAELDRERILQQLQNADANKRLLGALDARNIVAGDTELVRALLFRANEDKVQSVRTAAIEALGPSVQSRVVGNEVIDMLEAASSPLVQLSLVDLVLRNGSEEQLLILEKMSDQGRLHPDLARHVHTALGRESI